MVVGDDGQLDIPGLDTELATGAVASAQDALRRVVLTPGDLWESPGDGADLYSWQGESLTPAQKTDLQTRCQTEAEQGAQVVEARVTLTLTDESELLSVHIVVDTDDGESSELVTPLTSDNAAALATNDG